MTYTTIRIDTEVLKEIRARGDAVVDSHNTILRNMFGLPQLKIPKGGSKKGRPKKKKEPA